MTNNHYEAVIADLVAKRDAINATIASLQALSGSSVTSMPASAKDRENMSDSTTESLPEEGRFLGMSIVEGTRIILTSKRKKLKTSQIVEYLEAGGMEFSSASVTNTVGSVLRRHMKNSGDIVAPDRGYWGLKEWYPGRSFGRKEPTEQVNQKTETSEQPQPSSPKNVVPLSKADLF